MSIKTHWSAKKMGCLTIKTSQITHWSYRIHPDRVRKESCYFHVISCIIARSFSKVPSGVTNIIASIQ